jgi:hypothetical protein
MPTLTKDSLDLSESDVKEHLLFSKLENNDPDIIWLSFVYVAITNIATEDPLPIHQYASRKILKEIYKIDDPRAIDILARELVEHCRRILSIFDVFKHHALNQSHSSILKEHLEDVTEQILQIDQNFIQYLKKIGKEGKKLSGDISKKSKELYANYKQQRFPDDLRPIIWGLWVTKENKEFLFLSYLAMALWEDQCSIYYKRETTGHASLGVSVIEKIIPILGPKHHKQFLEKDGDIIYSYNGTALLIAPAISPAMLEVFQKGIQGLSSLTGHKLLRWQVNTGFEQWAMGSKDPRSIEIDGGFSKIAEIIKSGNRREIRKIRDILHAQAYGRFIFSDGSHGNMIQLRITEYHNNKEPSKINIILGDMLLPTYVCQLRRDDRLLIPIGDLPPFYGSPNTHASQAQLQLLVFQEFSKQSVRLAENGSVFISKTRWIELAYQAGIPPDKISSILEHWCQPELFNCFLEKQGDEFTLASHYERAQTFLKAQGQGRLINAMRGRQSANKKRSQKAEGCQLTSLDQKTN